MCVAIFTSSAQNESTKYFYMGYLYSSTENDQHEFYPYLTVLLSKEAEPDKVIAASMCDPRGEFNFMGVPIDCEQNYLFTVLMPNNKRVFRWHGVKVDYPSGNLNTNICLNGGHIPTNYYSNPLSISNFDNTNKNGFMAHLLQQCNIVVEDDNYYRKSDDAVMMPFIEQRLAPEMVKKIMATLAADDVSSVNIIELTHPNEYFAGAIHIRVPALQKHLRHQKPQVYDSLEEIK